jgi:hypothetical protein
MSDTPPESCNCCAGVDAETPRRIHNPPGLPAIGYRVGVHARFKESMLARLSSTELAALVGLTTRDDSDFTVAMCDAVASTLDVLSFYQERIANENFLRTATERRSILELARLIGYELAPGVAASTWLAFSLQDVPGNPALAAAPVTLPVGVKVQSVPGQDETPQTFETVESVEARVEWNAMPVQATAPWQPRLGARSLWLAGVGTGVQAGDAVLIVGQERLDDPGSERWDIRLLTQVTEDRDHQRTQIEWNEGLGNVMPLINPTASGASVYVFRQRAALFGHNAPDPRLMGDQGGSQLIKLTTDIDPPKGRVWSDYKIKVKGDEVKDTEIDLDAAYSKLIPGGWLALVSNEPSPHPSGLSGYVELYRASAVRFPSRSDFGLSGKITRVTPDTSENLSIFSQRLRESLVLAQSEPLQTTDMPLRHPLYGDRISLAGLASDIGPGRALAISGKRASLRLRSGMSTVALLLDDGSGVPVSEGNVLRLAAPAEMQVGGGWEATDAESFTGFIDQRASRWLRLRLIDRNEQLGTLTVQARMIQQVPAQETDEMVQEIAFIGALPADINHDRDRSHFKLSGTLKHCYDRETVRVNANVARATHGETVTEVLGSGNARQPNARFALRQSPLTHVSAATPSGRQSTLALRANDLLWNQVPSLFERAPTDRVYALRQDDEGHSAVLFGDGVEGARPPTGDHNLRAVYRKGLGLGGNVRAGQLSTLLSRPLGVTGASNPEAATGGEDAEPDSRARDNAPLTVRTLDRAVSIRDYQDFARAFAGIAKAHALWIASGPARGVFLTVAGEDGAQVPTQSATHRSLFDALLRYGDPLMPVRLVGHRDARFRLRLAVKVAADADAAVLMPAVERALRTAFGFDNRHFGQGVSVDAVVATVHTVVGVDAVQVFELRRSDEPASPAFQPRLFAALPLASVTALPLAAELLVLDAAPLTLEQMP